MKRAAEETNLERQLLKVEKAVRFATDVLVLSLLHTFYLIRFTSDSVAVTFRLFLRWRHSLARFRFKPAVFLIPMSGLRVWGYCGYCGGCPLDHGGAK